ncbi:MAG: hypothetical protein GY749_41245 [Desulfobacteraceae bacterium]|nr:hypothetical protein [Desulfobacteraceae bacterium]
MVLTVHNKKGVQKKIRVKRTSVRSESVVKRRIDKIPVVKILSFTKNTQRELKYILADLNKKKPIIFDLRENPGGDLHSAIDSAMLVLEKDKKIVDIKKSGRPKSYKSLGNTVNSASPLYLWQDGKTASAAEVFIAALTQNGRAISVGKTTYGKGTEQDIIELSDGSAIFLTTGYLETPDGTRYNEKGIEPTYAIEADSPKTDHYLSKVKELIRQKVSAKLPSPDKPEENKDNTLPAPKSQETAEPTPLQDNHFICFDRNFDTENDAEIWTSVLRKSFNKLDEQYMLQRNTPEGIKFIVCMGPYKTAGEADEKHKKISEAINVSMFTQSFKNGDFGIIESDSGRDKEQTDVQTVSTGETKKETHPESGSWVIQTGAYSNSESALSAIKDVMQKKGTRNLRAGVQIIASGDTNELLKDKQKLEDQGVEVRFMYMKEGAVTTFRVFIGPYEKKDEVLLDDLKQSSIIDEYSYWYELKKNN